MSAVNRESPPERLSRAGSIVNAELSTVNEPTLTSNLKPLRKESYGQTLSNESREQKKELQRLQKQFSKLEGHLNELTQQKTNIEANLALPENYADKNKFLQLESSYKSIQQKIAAANKEYESLFEKIMQLESEI